MSRSSVIVLAIGILAAVGLGWFMLSADVTSYEDKYTSCMEIQKSWLPGYTFSYPSPGYDAASRQCEEQANR